MIRPARQTRVEMMECPVVKENLRTGAKKDLPWRIVPLPVMKSAGVPYCACGVVTNHRRQKRQRVVGRS